ncbi:MAG: AbrB/MazE/SpoVT family DNA-binding domain-containing protein [Nanoarchaeota archaeon]|nr:AbrB/MazE/SpoVT family DNA-binding domain-containing protein [Nanoarchaeota archaeon]
MSVIDVKVKKWGNSFGVVIPREVIESENIKEEEDVRLIVVKNSSKIFKETFGIGKGKLKKSGQEFKDEARRELY